MLIEPNEFPFTPADYVVNENVETTPQDEYSHPETELKFEMQQVRLTDDTGIQFDTWMLRITTNTNDIDDEARVYLKERKWRFVIFDAAGEKISEIRQGVKPFWEGHIRRDKEVKRDLVEFGFCDKNEVDKILSQIGDEAKKNQALFIDVKNFIKVMESDGNEVDEKPKLGTQDIINLIENDVLNGDVENAMFSVNGIPYLILPHCKGIFEEVQNGTRNCIGLEKDIGRTKMFNLSENGSEKLRAELQRLCRMMYGTPISRNIRAEAISAFQGDAYENSKIGVNRIQHLNGAIYNDLMLEKDNKIVKITKDGWEMLDDKFMLNPDNSRYVFLRYPHQLSQVIPSTTPNIELLYPYYDLQDDEKTFLMVVDTIACFFPHVQQPIKQVEGPAGAGKTKRGQFMSSLVDPTIRKKGDNITKRMKVEEFVRMLYQGYFAFFDNVSQITKEQNDVLAQVVTGLSYTGRKLWSDDDAINYPDFTRPVLINGIVTKGTESDVLDRTIIYEVKKAEIKIDDNVLMSEFEKDKPHILSAIFDIVSKALGYIDEIDIELPSAVRLRDFARFGCTISMAMGYEPEKFLNTYLKTFEERDQTALESNPLGAILIQYMNEFSLFSGTPDELLLQLQTYIQERKVSVSYGFPYDAKSLGEELAKIQNNLEAVGIKFVNHKPKGRREYVLGNKNFNIDPSRKPIFGDSGGIKIQINK